ncbi:MAG TPA: hypothetical protein VE969_10680 [Pyrinomonadaceae bacterium]|nr:hypothetical protein [Pyrinomonadaceae bacterium]
MQKLNIFKLLFPLLVIVTLYGQAMPQSSAQTQTEFQYAAKFVCGKSDGELAARGQYFTIINVHNPFSKEVNLRKKFALGKPSEDVGDVSGPFRASIGADKVMGIDCPDIYKHTRTKDGTFIEGYAVLLSPVELDVVSVFTAGEDHVETLNTERVPFRKVAPEVCSDLNMNISTGFSPWRIIDDPISSTTEPRSVTVLLRVNDTPVGPFPFLAGSLWVGPLLNAGIAPVPRGPYKYEFRFCLCRGFSNAKLSLDGFANDSANVSLNGTTITPGLRFNSVSHIDATSGFVPGDNIITVVVTNKTNSPTGLNIRGSITATAGSCSGNTPQ